MRITITEKREIEIDENAVREDLKKLYGIYPYDGPENYVRGDGYFSASFKEKHGATVEQLVSALKFEKTVLEWRNHRATFKG